VLKEQRKELVVAYILVHLLLLKEPVKELVVAYILVYL
jgi:hypothetical protein